MYRRSVVHSLRTVSLLCVTWSWRGDLAFSGIVPNCYSTELILFGWTEQVSRGRERVSDMITHLLYLSYFIFKASPSIRVHAPHCGCFTSDLFLWEEAGTGSCLWACPYFTYETQWLFPFLPWEFTNRSAPGFGLVGSCVSARIDSKERLQEFLAGEETEIIAVWALIVLFCNGIVPLLVW